MYSAVAARAAAAFKMLNRQKRACSSAMTREAVEPLSVYVDPNAERCYSQKVTVGRKRADETFVEETHPTSVAEHNDNHCCMCGDPRCSEI